MLADSLEKRNFGAYIVGGLRDVAEGDGSSHDGYGKVRKGFKES
jgi:hypothetical protein